MTHDTTAVFSECLTTALASRQLWISVCRRHAIPAETPQECFLCSGLLPAATITGLTSSVSSEAVAEVITSHSHYKHVELEVLRVPARIVTGPGVTRVVPESDRIYTADEPGFYRLTVHDSDDQLMAMDIDIGPMATGSTLSSLAVQIGRRFPA